MIELFPVTRVTTARGLQNRKSFVLVVAHIARRNLHHPNRALPAAAAQSLTIELSFATSFFIVQPLQKFNYRALPAFSAQ
jgi:hypothetical protein